MSYLRRVAIQRPINQVVELRRKREEERHLAKLKRGRPRFNPQPVSHRLFVPEAFKDSKAHLSTKTPEQKAEKRSMLQRLRGFFQKITEIKLK